jgi:hypothetical protein
MRKSLVALVAASSVAVAAVCTLGAAKALGRGAEGGGSAFTAGHARPDYAYPYGYRYYRYPAYPYYGYPAYYGYRYYAPRRHYRRGYYAPGYVW